ncbi:MAG: DUF58 domain-containing protein [Nitrospiraceae bacterium]
MRLEWLRSVLRRFYRYRSIRNTPEGTRYVLLTLAVGIAAINTGNNLLYLLLAMMLSLIIMSGLLSEQCLKQLDVRRRMPEHIFANRPATASLSVTNCKRRLPTFSLRVVDMIEETEVDRGMYLFHLPPRATVVHTYPTLIPRRGLYRIEQVKLFTRFPFGLFIKAATIPLLSEVIVYPDIKPLPTALLQDLSALGQDLAVPRRGSGVALYNLRNYRAGDDSRTIHWKTSARLSRLMVREHEAEDQRRVTLVLPTCGSYMGDPAFERAVELIASLASFYYQQGYAIRAMVGDVEVPYGQGVAHYYQLLRVLGLCQPVEGSGSKDPSQSLLKLRGPSESGGLALVVLARPESNVGGAYRDADRILHATDYL